MFGENAPLQAIRDRFGNAVQITYDNNQVGTIRQITSPSGRWIQFSYDDASRVVQAKDNIGRVVSYTYDAAGNLATVTDPEHRVTSYTYDGNHQMLTVKPPNLQGTSTNLVTNEYTTAADAPTPPGWVKRQTHADGGVFQFSYTVVGGRSTQTDVTDPRGVIRRVTYNADGYSLSETLALGQTEQQTTTYVRQAGTNFLTSTTDALSRQTTQTYDAKGNLLTVTRLANTSQPVTTVYTYEPTFSQIATITDPLNHTTTFGYDALGRRTTTTDALTHATTYGYDAAGQVTSVTDPLQHAWVIDYASGAPVKLVDPLDHVTRRFLDAGGRVVSQSNPLSQTTRFTYDQVNHVTGVTDPTGATTTYGFDAAGRLATVTDARTNVTAYTFDAFNRVVARTDPLVKTETFAYDLNGNPSERIDRMGQVTRRTYDALNRLSLIQFADSSTLSYTHDAGNRVTAIADSLNGSITRTFDDLDRLTSETTPLGSVTYTYDAADRRATMTVSGQPTISYGYDAANHLTSITQGTASIAIGYDAADRRTTLTLPNGVGVTSSYDNASQLTGLTYSIGSTTLGTLTYAYDAAGRRIEIGGSWARTALPVAMASATYDAANRMTTWADGGFTYDANGHYTGDGFTSYVWDARNQLVALTGSANASFQYDATRRRTAKTVGGQTTQFRYDLTDIAQEMVGGAATANLIGGLAVDEWFVRTDSAGQRALLTDALGSVLAEADGSGAIRTEYTYEPFGFPFASGESSGNPLRFTGRESDDASLQFSRARYYHPGVGRFASEDPLPGVVSKPATLNLYAYGYNNPLSFVDPLGTEGQCKPRCARVFFDCVLDGLLPGLSTLVQGALEGGLDLAAVLSFNQALDYAAGRGLSYPYKSSVFREIIERVGIFQGARGFVAPLVLDYYVGKCLVVEYNSYRSGQCVP